METVDVRQLRWMECHAGSVTFMVTHMIHVSYVVGREVCWCDRQEFNSVMLDGFSSVASNNLPYVSWLILQEIFIRSIQLATLAHLPPVLFHRC